MDTAPENDRSGHLLRLLGEKWTVPLLEALSQTPQRFNDLHRRLGTGPKVLTRKLRSLAREGLIERRTWPSGALHVEYELTARGRELYQHVQAIARWSTQGAPATTADTPTFPAGAHTSLRRRPHEPASRVWPALGPAPLMHVSVVVRDIRKASGAFADSFGIPSPTSSQAAVTVGGRAGTVLICSFKFRNFRVEFLEHVSGSTPFAAFTREHGDGIHHLGFDVGPHSFEDRIRWLEQHGGACVLGGADTSYAEHDFTAELGTTFEMVHSNVARQKAPRSLDGALASLHATHVGVVVHDIDRAARAYATVLGVDVPEIRHANPRFPAHVGAASEAHARIAILRQPNVVIRLIEPVGASPLRDHLDRHGSSVHHVGLSIPDNLEATIGRLQSMGGTHVLGGCGDRYAHIDLQSKMGLILEITGAQVRTAAADSLSR